MTPTQTEPESRSVSGGGPLVPLQSYDQVAAHFGVDRQTLARWVKERKFPRPLAIGTRRYWSATAINKWVLAQEDRLRDEETVQRLVAAS